jgi:hypothetical protein
MPPWAVIEKKSFSKQTERSNHRELNWPQLARINSMNIQKRIHSRYAYFFVKLNPFEANARRSFGIVLGPMP